jgi:ABC-type transport system involved in multi-copper enzyme maturation permease subunit
MKGLGIVLRRDVKDIVHSKTFLIYAIILSIATIGGAVGATILLDGWLPGLAWADVKPALELTMGLLLNYVPLLMIFVCIATWATEPLAKEKARGSIESLLATPLTAKTVWMGKSLAIFLPAYIISVISTLVFALVMNFASILPATGHFFLPPSIAVTCFLFLPLLMFALTSLGVLLSLITNPAIGQIIVVIIGVILLQVIGQVGGRITWLLASWDYALYILAGAALLGVIALRLSRPLLTKESIILSSKGKWA